MPGIVTHPGEAVRISLGEAATLSMSVRDALGDAIAVSSCEVSYARDGGGAPIALGSAAPDGTMVATVTPEASAELCAGAVTWSYVTAGGRASAASRLEVASAHYFDLQDLRGYGGRTGADDFSQKGGMELFAARAEAVSIIERCTCRSFVRRVGRFRLQRPYGGVAPLPACDVARVVSASDADGHAVALALVGDSAVAPRSQAVAWPVDVIVEYGLTSVPDEIREAALKLAAWRLSPSAVPENATGQSTEAGYISFTLAGRDGATGIPAVDSAIGGWRRTRMAVT